MSKNSILLKISVFFFIALLAITALFVVIEKHEYISEKEKLREHYHHMAMAVMKWKMGNINYDTLTNTLQKNNMSLIEDIEQHKRLKSLVSADNKACTLGDFYIYEEDNFRYVLIPPIFGKVLLKDHNPNAIDVSDVWWLYAAFLLIIFLLFASIAISLYPLKKLQLQIHHFGEGQIDIDFSSKRHDEIADVSNEFNNAAKKIKDLIEARMIFLRNITHEFKTPITSGKLALEFIEDSKSKDVLKNVFTKLELLVKESVQIEKITATHQDLTKKSYPLVEILAQANDLLFLEANSIKNNFSENKLEVNFELFTIVFKNLIDNGLKYSTNKDFYIECDANEIHFCSAGQSLDKSLDYYLEPFTKTNINASESFGLGLYIVDIILKKHKYKLLYKHQDGYNYFTINLS